MKSVEYFFRGFVVSKLSSSPCLSSIGASPEHMTCSGTVTVSAFGVENSMVSWYVPSAVGANVTYRFVVPFLRKVVEAMRKAPPLWPRTRMLP